MTQKILTITVPSYNVENFLSKAVNSFIADEIISDIEIIIVNDGSRDRTLQIAQEFRKQYPDTIKVIDKANGGHGSAINAGIDNATGKYFKVVDADDWVDTKEFIAYVKALRRCDEDIIFNPYNEVDVEGKILSVKKIPTATYNTALKLVDVLAGLQDIYGMHAITFKTELLKGKIKITEHCFYVDQEYIVFPLKDATTIRFMAENIYQYRLGDSAQSVSIQSYQRNKEMHRSVIGNLLRFYKGLPDTVDKRIKEFIKFRIIGLLSVQTDIYLSLGLSLKNYKQLKAFLGEIKQAAPDIYQDVSGATFNLMRASVFVGYIAGWLRRRVYGIYRIK